MRKTPLKRNKPLKQNTPLAKQSKTKAKRAKKDKVPSVAVLDDLFSKFVRAKANHECRAWKYYIPCSSEMNNAHLLSRRFRCIRWNELNTVCLCVAHHNHFGDHPSRFYKFIEDIYPGRWDVLDKLFMEGKKITNDDKRDMAKRFREYLKTGVDPFYDGGEDDGI